MADREQITQPSLGSIELGTEKMILLLPEPLPEATPSFILQQIVKGIGKIKILTMMKKL
jgi:hypothetical protein